VLGGSRNGATKQDEAMKKLLMLVGVLVAALVLFLVYARVFGFNPGATSPGLWMKGEVVNEPVKDWSFGVKAGGLTGIETRQWFFPALAHSVTATRFHHKGRLYIGSGYPAGIKLPNGRHWNRNLMSNPQVRIRIDGKIYPGKAVYVTDPAEREEIWRAYGPMFWAPGFFLHLWRVEPPDAAGA
jgi:hypothetical protein